MRIHDTVISLFAIGTLHDSIVIDLGTVRSNNGTGSAKVMDLYKYT
jgi:hypothetical protein